MTWKAGDLVSLPIYLYGPSSAPLTFATATAFNAAGWQLTWLAGAVALTTQPTYTIAPDPVSQGADGRHFITFSTPAGVLAISVTTPTGAYSQWDSVYIVCSNDDDSLAAGFARGSATVSATGGSTALSDQSVTEGDGFAFQLPAVLASQLSFYDATNKTITSYADLSNIGGNPWTVACQARRVENNGEFPTVPVAFSLSAAVQSTTSRTLVVGWTTPPTGSQIDDLQATATAGLSGGAIGSISVVTPGMYFGSNPIVTISGGGGGTGAAAQATVVNGQVTAIAVTAGGSGYSGSPTVTLSTAPASAPASRRFMVDVQLLPPIASTFAGTRLTVFSFGIVINRQQTTTP